MDKDSLDLLIANTRFALMTWSLGKIGTKLGSDGMTLVENIPTILSELENLSAKVNQWIPVWGGEATPEQIHEALQAALKLRDEAIEILEKERAEVARLKEINKTKDGHYEYLNTLYQGEKDARGRIEYDKEEWRKGFFRERDLKLDLEKRLAASESSNKCICELNVDIQQNYSARCDEVRDLETERDELKADLVKARDETDKIEEEVRYLKGVIDNKVYVIDEYRKENNNHGEKIRELESELKTERDALERKCNGLSERVQELETPMMQAYYEAKEQVQKKEAQMIRLAEQLADTGADNDTYRKAWLTEKERGDLFMQQRDKLREEITELGTKYTADCDKRVAEEKERADKLDKEADTMRANLDLAQAWLTDEQQKRALAKADRDKWKKEYEELAKISDRYREWWLSAAKTQRVDPTPEQLADILRDWTKKATLTTGPLPSVEFLLTPRQYIAHELFKAWIPIPAAVPANIMKITAEHCFALAGILTSEEDNGTQ